MLGKRVLVIEDDKDSLHAICELLRRAGHEVSAAETGREGLRLLHGESPPDLVVLDFWLPDMTGHALLTTRKRWPGAVQVPVVLVTGDDAWVDEHRDLRQLGVVGLLRKPLAPAALLQALEHATEAPRQEAPVVNFSSQSDADTAVAAGAARQVRRLSDLLTRASEVLGQGTDIQTQLRDVARAIVPGYATACVIERTDLTAALREVLCTQHESAALDADLRNWACQPNWLALLLTEVAETGVPRLLDFQQEGELLQVGGSRADIASARALGFESVVVVPMIARRRLFGLLTCASRATRRYGRSHLEAFADLGHRIALALDNAELLAAAQQARRDRDDLVHALTTQLQAPVTTLSSLVAHAQEPASGEAAALAQSVIRETRQLQERLRELIDYAQLKAGRLPLRMQDLELASLVRRVVDGARAAATRHTLHLQVDADATALRVVADPERLAQALCALIHVALGNSPSGSQVEVLLSRVEGELQMTVSDSGAHLPAEEIQHLNNPIAYAADDGASSAMPARFGLQLARALVEAQAGRFWIQHGDAPGNAFHCAIPTRVGAAPQLSGDTPSDAVILLVDSDLAFRRELQEILCERGYRVEVADNGLQAWQYLLAHAPPALILFDLVLPSMDGWELHAAVKGHATLQAVPTVVVSGLDRYRIEASLPDAQGYIEKPIRTAQLFGVVQRFVTTPARPRTLSVRPSSCL